ncbi:MAG: helix-turn-helix transcriptional regulator [Acidimicrobiia bacterium]|nr:helix-turn-helix transcriptional regulator [Acidimicrobiia bacterium]
MADRGALDGAMAAVGDRWSMLVVDALLEGPLRFGQLAESVGGIAPNILTARLRHLEREGLVTSAPYSRRPLRLAYELTGSGRDLAGALALLTTWGARRQGSEGSRRHEACGTSVETRWYCPTCDRMVDDAEADELRHV